MLGRKRRRDLLIIIYRVKVESSIVFLNDCFKEPDVGMKLHKRNLIMKRLRSDWIFDLNTSECSISFSLYLNWILCSLLRFNIWAGEFDSSANTRADVQTRLVPHWASPSSFASMYHYFQAYYGEIGIPARNFSIPFVFLHTQLSFHNCNFQDEMILSENRYNSMCV